MVKEYRDNRNRRNEKSSLGRISRVLQQWCEVANDFHGGSLLLGNGASIAVSESFDYPSLFKEACRRGHLSKEAKAVFEGYETTNFERVLREVVATSVQAAAVAHKYRSIGFEKDADEIDKAADRLRRVQDKVRKALGETVADVHPSKSEVQSYLPGIATFMRGFSTVLNMNYDVIGYWAMMQSNDFGRGHEFRDCFQRGGIFAENWKQYRQSSRDVTLVFYPHGNLCLVRRPSGQENKESAGNIKNLLDTVAQRWREGSEPILVSEGTPEEKEDAIGCFNYTKRVFDTVFPQIGDRLVVYGFSFSESDNHVLNAVVRSPVQKIAVSVFAKSEAEAQKYVNRLRSKVTEAAIALGVKAPELIFFDARSRGCWTSSAGVKRQAA